MSLTNAQYNAIMRNYSQNQISSFRDYEDRKAALYEQNPRLGEIDSLIADAGYNATVSMLNGNADAAKALHNRISELKSEREELLKQLNNNEPLEIKYHCPDCRDSGYIGDKKCHCFVQAEIDMIYDQSNLAVEDNPVGFNNFILDYYSDKKDPETGLSEYDCAKKALEECVNFVNNFDTTSDNIFLYGTTGVGKTFLSTCVANELLKRSHSVVYLTAFELFKIVEGHVFHHTDTDSAAYDNIFLCDMLIIDDLGTEYTNTFVSSQLYFILNERLLQNKKTMISTNQSIKDMQDLYTERVSSRIIGNYRILKLSGHDIRLTKRFDN